MNNLLTIYYLELRESLTYRVVTTIAVFMTILSFLSFALLGITPDPLLLLAGFVFQIYQLPIIILGSKMMSLNKWHIKHASPIWTLVYFLVPVIIFIVNRVSFYENPRVDSLMDVVSILISLVLLFFQMLYTACTVFLAEEFVYYKEYLPEDGPDTPLAE